MKNLIRTQAIFLRDSTLADLGVESGRDTDDFIFDLDKVESVNRAEDGIHSTIQFCSGFRITVLITFEEMLDIINDSRPWYP